MKLYTSDKESSIVIIEDFYSKDELELIWRELNFYQGKFLTPSYTDSAIDKNNILLKQNKGLFLDEIYTFNRDISDILKLNRKIFDASLHEKLLQLNPLFRFLFNCNHDKTLLSYYEDCDYYKSHSDTSNITVLNYFFKEPKHFNGGNIRFCDFDLTIQIKNNMTIIFPGAYKHEVDTIQMKEDDLNKNLGRYCMAQFLNYKI